MALCAHACRAPRIQQSRYQRDARPLEGENAGCKDCEAYQAYRRLPASEGPEARHQPRSKPNRTKNMSRKQDRSELRAKHSSRSRCRDNSGLSSERSGAEWFRWCAVDHELDVSPVVREPDEIHLIKFNFNSGVAFHPQNVATRQCRQD
jgi:hypothetical protein